MKTSIKYVTLTTIDPETGGPKALQIRNDNGDLRSRLLLSRLNCGVIKCFPSKLHDEILADYADLLTERDHLLMVLESYFVDAYTSIFAAGLIGLEKCFSPDEDNVASSFAEFKYNAVVGSYFEEAEYLSDVFRRSYDDEQPELLKQLLENRKALKKEITRLQIAIANLNDLFEPEDK
ncbi:MAG: hypothetical protein Q4E46_03470 [Candidatus Saccharibacteria bacterium]|nr:hypothetical protein [Candidatus Saccharibacteria bacterium]